VFALDPAASTAPTYAGGVTSGPTRREVIMRGRLVAIFVLVLMVVAPAARAQAPCSIQTVTGTYAVLTTGVSASGNVFESPLGPAYQLHGGAAVLVGHMTVASDGSVAGTYWGVYVAFPIPPTTFTAQVSVNPDCTGEVTDETGSVDKIVVLDNGQEVRAITWAGFGTSVGTWHRITRASDVAPRCGQHTLQGTYAERCEGFALTDDLGSLATTNSLFVFSARDGALNGTYSGKQFGFPDTLIESAVSGTYSVNPNCTANVTLSLDALPPGLAIKARSVLFDQGKQGIGVPFGIYAGDTMVAPMGPLSCQLVRIGQ
jgi:hypothetical protein